MSRDKSRREIAGEATQREIVAAAARLFIADGYHATSVGRIAREAGVAVQTVYNSVGAKREVLSRAIDYAVAGDRTGPVARFMTEQARAAADAEEIVAQLVDFWRGALPRLAPLAQIMREASGDPQVAALEASRAMQRLGNYRRAAGLIAERGRLRADVDVETAAGVIFAVGHPDVYRSLVLQGEWTEESWAEWARTTLSHALLGDARTAP